MLLVPLVELPVVVVPLFFSHSVFASDLLSFLVLPELVTGELVTVCPFWVTEPVVVHSQVYSFLQDTTIRPATAAISRLFFIILCF